MVRATTWYIIYCLWVFANWLPPTLISIPGWQSDVQTTTATYKPRDLGRVI